MATQTAERTNRLAELDVVVLGGGRGSRLGGVDKPSLIYRGRSLSGHVLSSVRTARRVVWVGDQPAALPSEDVPGLVVTREKPAFGGPSAALAAGLAMLGTDPAAFTLVLAADLPHAADAIPALLRMFDDGGVIAVDDTGRRQYLLAVYPSRALRSQIRVHSEAQALEGLPIRRLIDAIDVSEVRIGAGLCADVDTAEDAARHGIRPPVPSDRSYSR